MLNSDDMFLQKMIDDTPPHLKNLPSDQANIVMWSAITKTEFSDHRFYRAVSQDLAYYRHTYLDALWRDTEE